MQSKISFRSTARNRRGGTAWGFLSVSLAGTAVFGLLPLADVARRSLENPLGTYFTGIQNYKEALDNVSFRLAAANTAKFIAVGLPILLGLSLLLAVWLKGMGGGGGKAGRTVFLLPMVLPVSSLSFVWKLFFDQNGVLNQLLLGMGAEPVDFIHTDCSFAVLIFTYLWRNCGYAMILWLAALDGLDAGVYEAARVDGAGGFRIFRSITLPLLRPAAFTITVLSVLNSFKVFRDAYLIAGDYPHRSMYMLQHLFNNWFAKMEIGKMAAAAVMVTAVINILCGGLGYGLSGQRKEKERKG